MKTAAFLFLALCALPAPGIAQHGRAASGSSLGVPAPKPEPRAAMETIQIPSHGSLLNAFVYVAAGPGPHPAVILLHGFPGNEKNLDLAQAIRSAGWDVLYFNYRGSWGTPGDFSFQHSIDDTASAIAYVRDPAHAKALRLDPSRIVLIGHSMGGFMAIQGAAADPAVAAVGLISAADMAGRFPSPIPAGADQTLISHTAENLKKEGMAPLAGCTPEGLARELVTNTARWRFLSRAPDLATRPVLVVTSNDGLAPSDDAFAQALRSSGDTHVTTAHFDTDHAYSDERTALIAAVLNWIGRLPIAPAATTAP